MNYLLNKKSFSIALYGFLLLGVLAVKILTQPSIIMSPLPSKSQIWDKIRSALLAKDNTFKLKKEFSIVPQVQAATAGDVDPSAYVVIDFDSGKIIGEKNMSQKLPIASLTKLMTATVALDLASPDEEITVSQNASEAIPTKINIIPGEKFKLEELLNAILLTSANDAAAAIRDGIDAKYGDEVFIKAMNEKAKILKLKNTHFANPQGFDNPNNYSTAEDLAILTHYALSHYPLLKEIVKKDKETLAATSTHRAYNLPNWQALVDVYPGAYGVKIGNTAAAGTTTVVASERDGKNILAVMLGAPDILKRDIWASELLDMGFENTVGLKPADITAEQLQEKYNSWYNS